MKNSQSKLNKVILSILLLIGIQHYSQASEVNFLEENNSLIEFSRLTQIV